MSETPPLCPDCATAYDVADNYCRQCGMYLAALRTIATVPQASRAVEPVRAGLPAPVKKAATAVAIGTALQLAVGLTGKYLARQATRQAAMAMKGQRAAPAKREVAPRPEPARAAPAEEGPDGVTAVSETLVIQRVWMRRGR